MTPTTDPLQRLAAYQTQIDEGVRDRHLATVGDALRVVPTPATPLHLGLRRRFATALATLTIVVVPVGAAVAAEGSVPGEALYPIKRVSEGVRGWVDGDLAATHRVEELEVLLDRDAEADLIAETEARATAAVAELAEPGDLAPRLEQAQERIRLRTRQRIRGGADSSVSERGGPVVRPGSSSVTPGGGIPNPDETPGPGPGEPPADADLDRQRDRERGRDGSSGPTDDPPTNTDAPGPEPTNPGSGGGSGDESGGSGGGSGDESGGSGTGSGSNGGDGQGSSS